jgi:TnpA family transposase
MPVEFLTDAQAQRYGRFAGEPSAAQLARYFHLDDADRSLVELRRSDANRLGFAVQLCTVRFLGTFLADPTDVPSGAVTYISRQLRIDPTCLPYYLDRAPTHRDHAREIQRRYGYQDFHAAPAYGRLVRWLYLRAWVSDERPSLLFDLATARLVERKILLPGVTVLARLVARVRERVAQRLWRVLAALPDAQQRMRLEGLLVAPAEGRYSHLDRLRRGPTRISSTALVNAVRRLEAIRALGVSDLSLARVPPNRLNTLGRYAASVWAPTIARMPDDRRTATLLAFARTIETTALDDTIDVLDLLLSEILAEATQHGQQARLRTVRDLDEAALRLRQGCTILLDEAYADEQVRHTVFTHVPRAQLADAVAQVGALARPPDDHYYPELVEQYQRVRRFLPTLLRAIVFHSMSAGQPVLAALQFLAALDARRPPPLRDAPRDVVPRPWRRLVLGLDTTIDRRAYTLCVMERLQDTLRRRDVFVPGSERWGDPRAALLQGAQWEAMRPQICRALGRHDTAAPELHLLTAQLDAAYRRTVANFPTNAAVRLETKQGRDRLILTGLEKLAEPLSLVTLREQVQALLPLVDLPEVLLEIDARTGFTAEFTHISESGARVTDLHVSLCAVLLAEACNIGIEPLVRPEIPALTYGRLLWVQQNYLRAETLIRANARLVDAQTTIPLAQAWGGGEVASADGLRFVVPVRTLNAGPNRKYYGAERGITYYNFTSDQFTGFHGIVIPGTLRDSMFILEGLLEHLTSLRPVEVMADTGGVSDVVFGLFWLLGYQFSPRLADAGGARFWRLNPAADYGVLNGVARYRLRPDRVNRHWDDLLRIAGSLKTGTVSASMLLRSLLRSQRPSALTRAIGEVGRIAKTLYL